MVISLRVVYFTGNEREISRNVEYADIFIIIFVMRKYVRICLRIGYACILRKLISELC